MAHGWEKVDFKALDWLNIGRGKLNPSFLSVLACSRKNHRAPPPLSSGGKSSHVIMLAEAERSFCPVFSSVVAIHETDVTPFLSVCTDTAWSKGHRLQQKQT